MSDLDPSRDNAREARARALGRLADLIDALNGPEGCPWDREQSPADLVHYLLAESRELGDAVEAGDTAHVAEEWGDVVFIVLFFALAAERTGLFALPDAIGALVDKMIRRHPHVFSAAAVTDARTVVRRWEDLKAKERAARDAGGLLAEIAPHVSALRKAHALQAKAAEVGFDWPDIEGVWDKVAEEMQELLAARAANDSAALEHEIGDVLFSLVNLQRHLGLDAEAPLNHTANRFTARFREVERLARERQLDMNAATLEDLDALWDLAKAQERADSPE